MKPAKIIRSIALLFVLLPLLAIGEGSAAGEREWSVNSALIKGGGGWEGKARWWNWTGGKSGLAEKPNKVDWTGDGAVEFHAEDGKFDQFGSASDFQAEGEPLNMGDVGSLVYARKEPLPATA